MCKCKTNQTGIYGNAITLRLPHKLLPNLNCLGEDKGVLVCVDACIADEIKELWAHGIQTTGCCCGHNHRVPYIGVVFEHIERMKELGYKVQFNDCRPDDEDTFFPKIYYPYND